MTNVHTLITINDVIHVSVFLQAAVGIFRWQNLWSFRDQERGLYCWLLTRFSRTRSTPANGLNVFAFILFMKYAVCHLSAYSKVSSSFFLSLFFLTSSHNPDPWIFCFREKIQSRTIAFSARGLYWMRPIERILSQHPLGKEFWDCERHRARVFVCVCVRTQRAL